MHISSRAVSPWLGLVLYGIGAAAQALPATTLFEVDFSTDAEGGCRTVGAGRIQELLDEALALAYTDVQLVDYDSQPETNRLLDVFVNGNDAESRDKFRDTSQLVIDFLENNVYRQSGGTPYPFCSDTWLVRYSLDDNALNSDGKEFSLVDEGPLATIRQVPEYMKARANSPGKSPYWSLKHKNYLFDYSYGVGRGYCSKTKHMGATQGVLLPASITLCPQSFNEHRVLGSKTMTPLLSATIPQNPSQIPKTAQRLSTLLPSSSTLFHELFHLLLGIADSVPPGWKRTEEYEITDMGGMNAEQATMNPETYVATGVAYWYTTNTPPDNRNKVEFYGFFTTQG
ncbi:hypothetical protein B0I35DRAFT_481121 [Stachybotrys elegans]|uniref:Lysine-specific metallo-endopeptidase domain-containing protein n=1 Tax=Stachybotrys elegans TaxID=80388 RepID=A0A8K0SLA4_9HYPO|nr:hypothetical protein B0I35DRAFT_481121 [Stachybotrys elegans]